MRKGKGKGKKKKKNKERYTDKHSISFTYSIHLLYAATNVIVTLNLTHLTVKQIFFKKKTLCVWHPDEDNKLSSKATEIKFTLEKCRQIYGFSCLWHFFKYSGQIKTLTDAALGHCKTERICPKSFSDVLSMHFFFNYIFLYLHITT